MKDFPDLPPIWALGAIIASWVLNRVLPIWRVDPPDWIGSAAIMLGLGIILYAASFFFRQRTPIEPRHTPKSLIIAGPFRLSRNPIYLGMALILFGVAWRAGSLGAFLPVLAFPPIITARFIRGEEMALRAEFGAEAETYLTQTRRWI